MTAKREMILQLDAARREKFYNALHQCLREHFHGQLQRETPQLTYEALDAIALLLAGIFAGLHSGVGDNAAKTGKRYFRDRADEYVAHLKQQSAAKPVAPIIYRQ